MEEKTPEMVVPLAHEPKEHDNEQKHVRRERRQSAIPGRLGLVQNARAKRALKLGRSRDSRADYEGYVRQPCAHRGREDPLYPLASSPYGSYLEDHEERGEYEHGVDGNVFDIDPVMTVYQRLKPSLDQVGEYVYEGD